MVRGPFAVRAASMAAATLLLFSRYLLEQQQGDVHLLECFEAIMNHFELAGTSLFRVQGSESLPKMRRILRLA